MDGLNFPRPKRRRTKWRSKPCFQFCKLSRIIWEMKNDTVPPARSVTDHEDASYYQTLLQHGFLSSAQGFHKKTRKTFHAATSGPTADLDALQKTHNEMVERFEPELRDLMFYVAMLPMEYKQELEETEDWNEGARLILESDRMISILRFPLSVELRQREIAPLYEQKIAEIEAWKAERIARWNALAWKKSSLEYQFSKEPVLALDMRRTILNKIGDELDVIFQDSYDQLKALWEWSDGRLQDELCFGSPRMRDVQAVEGPFRDLISAAKHLAFWTSERKGQDFWTTGRLEALKMVLPPPRTIPVDIQNLSNSTHCMTPQKQLLENRCAICLDPYTDPTCVQVSGKCHHVFCFKCIVPWIDENEHCPTCRAHAEPDNLRRLVVSRVEPKADEDVMKPNCGKGDWEAALLGKKNEDMRKLNQDFEEMAKRMAALTIEDTMDVMMERFAGFGLRE